MKTRYALALVALLYGGLYLSGRQYVRPLWTTAPALPISTANGGFGQDVSTGLTNDRVAIVSGGAMTVGALTSTAVPWASPGAIGGTTPAAVDGTVLTAHTSTVSPSIGTGAGNQINIPTENGSTLITTTGTATLSFKTYSFPILNGNVTGTYTLAGTGSVPSSFLTGQVAKANGGFGQDVSNGLTQNNIAFVDGTGSIVIGAMPAAVIPGGGILPFQARINQLTGLVQAVTDGVNTYSFFDGQAAATTVQVPHVFSVPAGNDHNIRLALWGTNNIANGGSFSFYVLDITGNAVKLNTTITAASGNTIIVTGSQPLTDGDALAFQMLGSGTAAGGSFTVNRLLMEIQP